MKRIIFHSPLPISTDANSGSHVRPVKMLQAFKKEGYEVFEITGYGKERFESLKVLRDKLKQGLVFDFLYSESSTMPMFLTEKNHLPLFAFVEILLFRLCSKNKIPVTLFYRDIYWKFNLFQKGTSYFKRFVAYIFYHLELIFISRFVSILFLPSFEMRYAIPYKLKNVIIKELPPGISEELVSEKKSSNPGEYLNLIYVGGVLPPLYDLRGAINQISKNTKVKLTIVCRKNEWDVFSKDIKTPANVEIKHLSGKELKDEYKKSDLSLIVLGNHPYRRFCMPIKLFESFGFSTPVVILSSMQAATKLIEKYNLGYIIDAEDQLSQTLDRLHSNKQDIEFKTQSIQLYKENITWSARTAEIHEEVRRISNGT